MDATFKISEAAVVTNSSLKGVGSRSIGTTLHGVASSPSEVLSPKMGRIIAAHKEDRNVSVYGAPRGLGNFRLLTPIFAFLNVAVGN